MHVTRDDLEASLSELEGEVHLPLGGLHGPGSTTWHVQRESIIFLGGGRAALLQLAHPFVAQAVLDHSRTRSDPFGRFQRTFGHVFAMAFGPLPSALRAARRVHAIHERIAGELPPAARAGCSAGQSRYDANDADALFWVHATLVSSALAAYELVLGPLPAAERQRYYDESLRFARLFGIPRSSMPADLAAFERYERRMWGELHVSPAARELADFLLAPPAIRPKPLADWVRLLTAGLLPEPLRGPLGFRFGRVEALAFRASLATIRRSYGALPPRLRFLPAYKHATARLAGREPADGPPAADWLERLGQRVLPLLLGGNAS